MAKFPVTQTGRLDVNDPLMGAHAHVTGLQVLLRFPQTPLQFGLRVLCG